MYGKGKWTRSEIMIALMLGGWASGIPRSDIPRQEQSKTMKSCLNCGALHDHNNSYCSALCCKQYREANKRK